MYEVGKPDYRGDIDGLRAVAVLGVVVFHFGVHQLSGGFAGVDVFFVISGYVITRLIAWEMSAGQFSFATFYRRRVFRILPALFATVFGTLIAGLLLLPPDRFVQLAGSAIAAILSVSNILFWSQSGYFDSDAITKPLLHTWSLGVEEQFYMVWPALMLGLALFASPRRMALAVFSVAALVSLGLSQWMLTSHMTTAFYWMPFRVFEFAIGALLVFLPDIPYRVTRMLAGIAGLAMLAASYVLIDEKSAFPGLLALLPCLGAALVIAARGEAPGGLLLGNPVALYLGRISYSLYLVHWPLAVFWVVLFGVIDGWTETLILLAISVPLAHVMYHGIEMPLRALGREGATPARKRATRMIGASALATLVLGAVGAANLLPSGFALKPGFALSPDDLTAQKNRRFTDYQAYCRKLGKPACEEPLAGAVNILVIGDSHAPDVFNGLHHVRPDLHYVLSSLGGCPPTPDIRAIAPANLPNIERCEDLNRERFDPAWLARFDIVVINILPAWFGPAEMKPFIEAVKNASDASIIVYTGFATLKRDASDIMQSPGFAGDASFADEMSASFPQQDAFYDLASDERITLIDKKAAFCDPECRYISNGVPFTWDRHHLSIEYAYELGEYSKPVLERVLAGKSR